MGESSVQIPAADIALSVAVPSHGDHGAIRLDTHCVPDPCGDLEYADEGGYFYITGRKKDIIIRGGENVSPVEVEEVLLQHPAVAEAGVVGIPDSVYGEEIKAFVVTRAGKRVSEGEIIAFCKDRLPTFKSPKKVQFIESLPRNLLGKVLRAELRQLG